MGRSDADAATPASGSDVPGIDGALKAFPPGKTLRIDCGAVSVEIAPEAGGRIAQITHDGVEWLLGYSADNNAMIAWGCYPMLPWAGRIRSGRFEFEGRSYRLPRNLGHHAIHGVGFALPWQVESHAAHCIELSLQLPEDERWPFGGRAFQRIEAGPRWLRLELSVTAGEHAMPAVIGWHPWLRKPEHLHFAPTHVYPRDANGIATLPLADPPAPPWDDCFINLRPVEARRRGRTLRLASNCRHWVVYDQPLHATCIEPQSGPPDAFNIEPEELAAGARRSAWFLWEWL